MLRAAVVASGADEDDVEDAVQEAALMVWRKWGRWDPQKVGTREGWAWKIALREAWRWRARRGWRVPVVLLGKVGPVQMSSLEGEAWRVRERERPELSARETPAPAVVVPAVRDHERRTWELRALGWTRQQIADELGIGLGTVKHHLANVRREASGQPRRNQRTPEQRAQHAAWERERKRRRRAEGQAR